MKYVAHFNAINNFHFIESIDREDAEAHMP